MKRESIILKPKRSRTIGLLLVCTIFVAVGSFLLDKEPIVAWFTIVFFGLGVIVFIIQLFPNASYLKLTKEGFEIRSLFRSDFTNWKDVQVFRSGNAGPNKMVMFDFAERHKKFKQGKKIAKSISGNQGALPNSYGMSVTELAELMNEWKLHNT